VDADVFLAQVLGRIYRLMAVLSAVGSVILTILRGWKWGVGFLVGAAISVLSFRLIHGLAAGLEPSRKRGGATRFAVLAAMRYMLFGIAVYVTIGVLGVSINSIVLGLFVLVAAILLEIIYELIYVRT
jgi:hypothetical protein